MKLGVSNDDISVSYAHNYRNDRLQLMFERATCDYSKNKICITFTYVYQFF